MSAKRIEKTVRRAQRPGQHLSKISWSPTFYRKFDVFSYSLSKGGIYCRPCAIFAPDEVRGVKLCRIIKTPLQKHTHLTAKNGYLTEHLSKQFHGDSLSRSNAFVGKNNAGDVEQQVNVGAAKQRKKNRMALKRIIFSIEFLGRLGLPFLEHRDSGTLPMPQPGSSDIDYTQENFRAMLQFMAACNDQTIYEHINNVGRNSTYISPRIQNDLLDAMGASLEKSIIAEVKEARFFRYWLIKQRMHPQKNNQLYV